MSDIDNAMENITGGLSKAMIGLKDIGGDLVRILPKDESDNPIAIGLVCLDPEKAALIDEFIDSLEEDAGGPVQ